MGQKLIYSLVILFCMNAERGLATDDNIDSILDRLESRLMDSELDIMGVPQPKRSSNSDKKVKDIYTENKISGSLTEVSEIKDLAAAIASLDSKIDRLSADVQNTKQKILEKARLDNYISISAKVMNNDLAAIKNINVKIDGIEVYALKDEAGIWIPKGYLSIYSGPLRPGNHRVDVEVSIAMKHKKNLPLNGEVYRFVNKSISLAIPNSTFRRDISLNIIPPVSMDAQAKIEVKKKTVR